MELSKLKDKALRDIAKIDSVERLEALRIHYLGRKGEVTKLFTTLPKLNEEERKIRGQELNVLKREIEKVLLARGKTLEHEKLGTLVKAEKLDVTLPGARPSLGHLHITSQAIEEISRIFAQIGFNRVRYPEIDWDYYAFESLNMPKGHPARDEWETFFMPWEHPRLGRMVLTPHTSNGQVREMERRKPPIRMTNIAKCYRRQS
ncbi:MAG: Phenylalanine-tRNA ligase alpha subunit, partial [Parcubacteria group bacterium GW2011_GWC2_45_7]